MNKDLDLEKIKNRESFPLNTTFYIITKDEFEMLEEAFKKQQVSETKRSLVYTVSKDLQKIVDKMLIDNRLGTHFMPTSVEVSINSAYIDSNENMVIEFDTTENANSNRLKQLYGDNYKKGETK